MKTEITKNDELYKLNNLKAGKRTQICKVEPMGSLYAKQLAQGTIFFFFRAYSTNGCDYYFDIGVYDKNAPRNTVHPTEQGCYSLRAAKNAATTLSIRHSHCIVNGELGLHEMLQAEKEQEAALIEEINSTSKQTVYALLKLHEINLRNRNTQSELRSIVRCHLPPEIGNKVARLTSTEDWSDLLRIISAKAPRTANKLRTFALRAYNLAMTARASMNIASEFKDFKILANPLAIIKPNAVNEVQDIKWLSQSDLHLYFSLIKDEKSIRAAALRIHLFSGGLRPAQLLRLTKSDVFEDHFRLYDIKGQAGRPRPYLTPVLGWYREDIEYLLNQNCKLDSDFVFSTDEGQTMLSTHTLAKWAQDIVKDKIARFQLKQVRSGIETLLASFDVSKDIRGRLQSHGISGVQDRHYDGHDYLKQKQDALRILHSAINVSVCKVIKINYTAA